MSNNKPEFVDNLDGNTLANAISNHLEWLKDAYSKPIDLSIASGYFNPHGYFLLKDQFNELEHIKLLLGAEPFPLPLRPKRKPGDPKGESFDSAEVNSALNNFSKGLEIDRDHLGFSYELDEDLKNMIDFFRSGKIEVRKFNKGFLHGKAFVFSESDGLDEGLLSGSSNFTGAGLTTNIELNLGRYDPGPVRLVKKWFDNLWEQSEIFDLSEIYDVRYREYDPYLIYLRVLWELYNEELIKDQHESGFIPLTSFQKDGVNRAQSILEKYNGVLIADGVGLGKTFIGGELILDATRINRQRALLICPAALRDGTWSRFRDRYQIYLDMISYEQLSAYYDSGVDSYPLKANPDEYSLVVIDEAAAYVNSSTERASALRQLLQGFPPKKLALMTATPVNNSVWDLYNLLNYFIKQDAAFAHKGIISMRKRFNDIQSKDVTDLKQEQLFDILDEVAVKRTRSFVKKYYANETIDGPYGPVTIQFPKAHVNRIDYDMELMLPGLLEEFEEKVMPENSSPELTLARYSPDSYLKNAVPSSEMAIIGFIRSFLLKRLESSPYAFNKTLNRMIENHRIFLDGLDNGVILKSEDIREIQQTDNDESHEIIFDNLEAKSEYDINDYDVQALKYAVQRDIEILIGFLKKVEGITSQTDLKLLAMVDAIKDISQKANEDGIGEIDIRDKSKVLIFSYFADTVEWIEQYLRHVIENDPDLQKYQGRLAFIHPNKSKEKISREEAIFGFAPISTEAPPGRNVDNFDILISTDVLAEGQNLQQCRNIINYDLPWNPMRLVQRHGRIDRIGSPHTDVYMSCVFPDKNLDKLLDLEDRLRLKIAQAAATIGVENEVIPGSSVSDINFAKKDIKDLYNESSDIFENGGEDPNSHSGEEYRQELRMALNSIDKRHQLEELPWSSGSGFVSGFQDGYFFLCKIGERTYMRFIPGDGSEPISDTLQCLKRISCNVETIRYIDSVMQKSVYDAWIQAKASIFDEWQIFTDPANLSPRIRPRLHNAAQHLRDYPPSDIEQFDLDQADNSILAPWPDRYVREFSNILKLEMDNPYEKSRLIYEKILELGLEPFIPPDPFPPIEEDEIHLICWMIVSTDK